MWFFVLLLMWPLYCDQYEYLYVAVCFLCNVSIYASVALPALQVH